MRGVGGSAVRQQFPETTRSPIRQHVRWIIDTCGVWEASEFLVRRHELGLIDNEGRHRDGVSELVMRAMISSLQYEMQREIHDFRDRLLKAVQPRHQKLPPKGKHVIVSESWEKQRALIVERDNKRREELAANRQRVRAAPKPAPIQLHRRRLERSLDATPMETTTATPPQTHSRRTRGEVGQRLGRKIDLLVAEIQATSTAAEIEHQRSCVSACCTVPELSSEDPPVTAFGGGAEASADDSADGGIGFSLEKGSAWDAFSGRPECVNAISAFLEQLDDEPRLRSAAMLRTLGRVREQLERTSEQAPLDTQVCIRLQDALVLMTQLMSRLR